ncbi:MAG: hypothetical protein ACRDR6_10590 [Pseudonocardiaceae bacterium]
MSDIPQRAVLGGQDARLRLAQEFPITDFDRLEYSEQRLQGILAGIWSEGEVNATTVDVVPHLVELLMAANAVWRPWMALILGMLVEGQAIDPTVPTAVGNAVAAGYDRYRRLLDELPPGERAARLSLLYLLAHFPDRGDLLEALDRSPQVESEDATRVVRCTEDPGLRSRFQLGRVWPSPAHWQLSADEEKQDANWRLDLGLPAEAYAAIRSLETQSLLAYLGAQAEDAAWRNEGKRS